MNGIGVARLSPHPHAALLYHHFMLTEGQEILARREFFPTNPKVKPLPEGLDPIFVDSAKLLDERGTWEKLYKQVILDQAR